MARQAGRKVYSTCIYYINLTRGIHCSMHGCITCSLPPLTGAISADEKHKCKPGDQVHILVILCGGPCNHEVYSCTYIYVGLVQF